MSEQINDMLKGMEECKIKMLSTANRMERGSFEFEGDSASFVHEHAVQMRGAAKILQTWIDGIRNETKKGGG